MNISSVVPTIDTATKTMMDFEKVEQVHRRRSTNTCSKLIGISNIGNFCFWVPCFKLQLLRNCAVDFVEICNVYVGKMIIKAAKKIFNYDKICRNYCNFKFWRHFFGTQCISCIQSYSYVSISTRNLMCLASLITKSQRHNWSKIFKNGSCDYDHAPFKLGLDTVYLHAKLDNSSFSCSRDIIGGI